MLQRFLLVLIVALSLSTVIASSGDAQDSSSRHRHPTPVSAPEFDSKLMIGGVAVTGGCVALLLERRRRRPQG
jgi:hypothetical protein